MKIPEAYDCREEETLDEYRSEAYVLEHKKSGAKVFVLENDDPNKVFMIGFRTPPADSTGVPHILEHSVLCGSEKYPVKDPFIELEKSSLRTFLNAMTYPDKTIYPVASCNEADFQNLMDVYMDAVLHPAIYREPKILRQEGWHLEMEDADSPLTINGVVYNEMKGAFSSPEDVLDRCCQAVLFPDTPYANESGGDPDVIPTLTQEAFLSFHRTYYHPSNSYLYLYGNADMEEKLRWLDEEYLSQYGRREIDSRIGTQTPPDQPADVTVPYGIPAEEDPEGKSYLSRNWVVGDITDPTLYAAFQILETVLLTAPGAPVKQALTDAGIGDDIFGGYQNSLRQPYFSVIAKNADESRKQEFEEIVDRTLREQAENGIDRRSLTAALNSLEFKNREADFGSFPKGLMVGIVSFDSWLYDASPLIHLRWEKTFAFLRKAMDEGYFESLIRRYLLDNPHRAEITLRAVPGLTEQREAQLAEKLDAYRTSLNGEEREKIVRGTAELRSYQSEPSTPEQLACLPVLTLSDIPVQAEPLHTREKRIGEIPVLHHETDSRGIVYLKILFRADGTAKEDLPWLGLLRSLLPLMPTQNYDYHGLYSEIGLETGGVDVDLCSFQDPEREGEYAPYFVIETRVLRDRLPRALELMQEILLRTNFHDEKRLRELVTQFKTQILTRLEMQGHVTAVSRASSYDSAASWFEEQTGGIDFARFLGRVGKQCADGEGARRAADHLESLARSLFVKNGMVVSLTAGKEDFALLQASFGEWVRAFPEGKDAGGEFYRKSLAQWPADLEKKNEGFKTASQIQYAACCGNFRKAGYSYTGALRVLHTILSNEYLWIQVRVRGGAYGCMCSFGYSGRSYFVSYRDPHLRETFEVYRGIVDYLKNFHPTKREMDNYIIGTIADLDRPMNPCEEGEFSLRCYMSRLTQEMRQTEREEVLHTTPEDIRALAPLVQSILDAGQICVVGSESKIEAERELFGKVESLQGAE